MDNWAWIIAGGAAVTGFLGAFWGYVRSFWAQAASRIVVTCEIRGPLADAVTSYFWRHFQVSRFGFVTYRGEFSFVRPTKRVQLIAMETIGASVRLYWRGWRPIWVSRLSSEDKARLTLNNSSYTSGLKLTFLRGTFRPDALMLDATQQYNQLHVANESTSRRRYSVYRIFGSAGKAAQYPPSSSSCIDAATPSSSVNNWGQDRLLQWQLEDLGTGRINHSEALLQLALSPESQALVQEIRRWKTSEDWYKARGIPWRRSCLLHGQPGTGKTSLIRALGEDFDLPIFSFNLATLHNDEFHNAWQNMLAEVPCIALIEDIDAVFSLRENVAGGHLTFDCLLNCLDGVDRADGVFLAVTTNHMDKVDSALSRPGRLDRILELLDLDEAGRLQVCQRILQEWPETWEETVNLGAGETGAQFQERCVQLALKKYWEPAC